MARRKTRAKPLGWRKWKSQIMKDAAARHGRAVVPAAKKAGHKVCAKCRTERPLAMFGLRRAAIDGKQAWCKPCMGAYEMIYRAKHPRVGTRVRRRIRHRPIVLPTPAPSPNGPIPFPMSQVVPPARGAFAQLLSQLETASQELQKPVEIHVGNAKITILHAEAVR